MTDFDYDALQKKRIARGARYMKRGSRSKACSLPSDTLSAAQFNRRNGPVITYKLDAPMSWDTFNDMPDDLKKEYIRGLQASYGATDVMMGEMFHVTGATVFQKRKELGVPGNGHRALSRAQKEQRDAMWETFCNGVVGGGDRVPEPEPAEEAETFPIPDPPDIPESEPEEDPPASQTGMGPYLMPCKVCAEFDGPFNVSGLMSWIAEFPFPSGAQVRIRVEVERV